MQSHDADEKLLTTAEVAGLLRMTEHTVRLWRASGRGPAFIKLSESAQGRVLYRRVDVDAFLDAQRTPMPAPDRSRSA